MTGGKKQKPTEHVVRIPPAGSNIDTRKDIFIDESAGDKIPQPSNDHKEAVNKLRPDSDE